MRLDTERLRLVHRLHGGLSLLVALTLLTLRLGGLITTRTAVIAFLSIELPLLALFVVLTVIRFRRATLGAGRGEILDRWGREEPLIRPALTELRAFHSLGLAARRRKVLGPGAVPFGYSRGSSTFPLVLVGLSVGELVIVHVLVPWPWLRLALALLTVWGVLFILGFLASRRVHPHFIAQDRLHLRWGHETVLATPLDNIASAVPHANHAHTQPAVAEDRLVLTQFQSTNVRLRFTEPVPAAAPVARKQRPEGFRAAEVELFVDDPEAFLAAVRSREQQRPGESQRPGQPQRSEKPQRTEGPQR